MSPLVRRLCLAATLVLLTGVAGALPEHFVLDRDALLHGEFWRLWTGHLVHASRTHFAYDVGAAALLCVVFGLPRRMLWIAPAISIALLTLLPELDFYYGLSACLHALVVALAARELFANSSAPRTWLAGGLLVGTLLKAAIETLTGQSLFTADLDFGGPVIHASHLVGALAGFLLLRTPGS